VGSTDVALKSDGLVLELAELLERSAPDWFQYRQRESRRQDKQEAFYRSEAVIRKFDLAVKADGSRKWSNRRRAKAVLISNRSDFVICRPPA
jgi:hypothetical protein